MVQLSSLGFGSLREEELDIEGWESWTSNPGTQQDRVTAPSSWAGPVG